MKPELLKAKWRQYRGRSRLLRAKITNNKRQSVAARYDILAGHLQERYISTRQRASRGINRQVKHYQGRFKKLQHGTK